MTSQRHDIAVIGGGLVGSAMALTIARQGFSVALLDRIGTDYRADPAFDGRAYAIAPGSANLLGALDIWDGLADQAQPVHRIEVAEQTTGPIAPASLHFDPAETDRDQLGWIVEDRLIRAALLRALDAAGVAQITPVAVSGVTAGPAMAEIAVENATPIHARLVVACDGRRSAIAQAQGIRYLAWSYGQTGLVSAIAHERPHGGVAHQSFFPGGPIAVLPLTGDRSAIVWSERAAEAARIVAASDADYMAAIAARIGGRLGEVSPEGRRWNYPLGLSVAQSYVAPRFVVAGDAAHGVHPIAGQGLNMGMRDVAALAEVLVEATRRGEDIGAPDILRRYQHWRRFDATAMALGMDGLNRMFSTDLPPLQALRNVGLRMAGRIGAVRRGFMGVASGVTDAAPRLLKGLPL